MKKMRILIVMAACLLLCGGCIFPSEPDITVSFYTLDYQPPARHQLAPLPDAIKIARFSSAQQFNTQAMLFKPRAGMQQGYNYSHWRVFPADLCTDYLSRDMRSSGLIKVVNTGVARFRLEGAVDEFWREDRPQGSVVRLALTCTLLDQQAKGDITEELIFQRNYIQEVPVKDESPLSMALAMSQAFAAFSQQVQYDIYVAAQACLSQTGK